MIHAQGCSLNRFLFCRHCLKKFWNVKTLALHQGACAPHIPAHVLFQNHSIVVFAVDGREPSCRTIARRVVEVGTRFLEQKFPLEDAHLFTFFTLFVRFGSRLQFAGFFSREHPRTSTSCLACIMVLEEYRGMKLGTFLAAISFALSCHTESQTSPERPLSISGQHLFASLWQRLVQDHFQSASCSSVEECSHASGVAVDDVLRALYTLRIVGVSNKSHHPLVFVPCGLKLTPKDAELLWP